MQDSQASLAQVIISIDGGHRKSELYCNNTGTWVHVYRYLYFNTCMCVLQYTEYTCSTRVVHVYTVYTCTR